jgi:pimeloyl-ACP methyl ester carboxylesterase
VAQNPVVLVHGYSDQGESFRTWKQALKDTGFDVSTVHTCSYRSLTNEVTIKDIAEGFDRALRIQAGLNQDEPFDAIVHSTGMLVIRSWLTTYPKRHRRLKRLIGLAPATFGSPLAHKGRSWLGAIFKGNKEAGPDFLEAGDLVLDGLELGSRFTWDLAHLDLLGPKQFYGDGTDTPYVFIFCGTNEYKGFAGLVSDPGTDGTVRLAGTAMNIRKINIDLTRDTAREDEGRAEVPEPKNVDAPMYPVKGKDHGTIMSDPGKRLIGLVTKALRVEDAAGYDAWKAEAQRATAGALDGVDEWQQFVVRAVDERGDAITDYHLQLTTEKTKGWLFKGTKEFDAHVHVYSGDASFRCFHVNLTDLYKREIKTLKMRMIASSGSELVAYHGLGSEKIKLSGGVAKENASGKWDAQLDLSQYLDDPAFSFFYPFTTTLIELRLNREPLPLEGKNNVCWFI